MYNPLNDQFPFYRGHEGFTDVLADTHWSLPGRVIRVYNYGTFSGAEKLYVIGTEKKLFDAQTLLQVEPQDVFSQEAAPHGWSVEGRAPHLLPDTEIEKLLSNPSRL